MKPQSVDDVIYGVEEIMNFGGTEMLSLGFILNSKPICQDKCEFVPLSFSHQPDVILSTHYNIQIPST